MTVDHRTEFDAYYDERVRFWKRTTKVDVALCEEWAEIEAKTWMRDKLLKELAAHFALAGPEVTNAGELL